MCEAAKIPRSQQGSGLKKKDVSLWKASRLIVLHLHKSTHPCYPTRLHVWEQMCKELETCSSFYLLTYSLSLCCTGAVRCVTRFSQHLPKAPKTQWTSCVPNVSITHLRGYIAVVWAPPLMLSFKLHHSANSTSVKCYFGITKKSWLTGRWKRRQ